MGYHDDTGTWRTLDDTYGITVAQLKGIDVIGNQQGERVQLSSGLMYYYHATTVLTGDDAFVIRPTRGPGGYLLAPGYPFDLPLPLIYTLADAAILATPPAGFVAELGRSYWEVTADWTGGSSSAIGISTNTAPDSTQGDLLGGAGGDVAATLVSSGGKILGTVGVNVAGGILLKGGVGVRYDEITSAFTAGTGFLHLIGTVHANPGA